MALSRRVYPPISSIAGTPRPLLGEQQAVGGFELHLARGVGTVAELVLEPLQVQPVHAVIGQEARHQETRQPTGRLGQHQERIAHWRRKEPLVTGEAIFAPGAGRTRGQCARGVGAHVRAALPLGHAHADECAALVGERREARVVLARQQQTQPLSEILGLLRKRGHRAVAHGGRALGAILDLGPQQVGGGAPRTHPHGAGAHGPVVCRAFRHQAAHQLVPCRMKLHFIAARPEAIQRMQLRRMAVGRIAQGKHLGAAEPRAQRLERLVVGCGSLAPERIAER